MTTLVVVLRPALLSPEQILELIPLSSGVGRSAAQAQKEAPRLKPDIRRSVTAHLAFRLLLQELRNMVAIIALQMFASGLVPEVRQILNVSIRPERPFLGCVQSAVAEEMK